MDENWVISLNFHDPSSKLSGTHEMSIFLEEFWVTVFMTQWFKKMDVSNEKWEQISDVFKTQKLKLGGMFVDKMRLWTPKASALSHLSQALGYYRWSSSVS